jgi:hypothetical protein
MALPISIVIKWINSGGHCMSEIIKPTGVMTTQPSHQTANSKKSIEIYIPEGLERYDELARQMVKERKALEDAELARLRRKWIEGGGTVRGQYHTGDFITVVERLEKGAIQIVLGDSYKLSSELWGDIDFSKLLAIREHYQTNLGYARLLRDLSIVTRRMFGLINYRKKPDSPGYVEGMDWPLTQRYRVYMDWRKYLYVAKLGEHQKFWEQFSAEEVTERYFPRERFSDHDVDRQLEDIGWPSDFREKSRIRREESRKEAQKRAEWDAIRFRSSFMAGKGMYEELVQYAKRLHEYKPDESVEGFARSICWSALHLPRGDRFVQYVLYKRPITKRYGRKVPEKTVQNKLKALNQIVDVVEEQFKSGLSIIEMVELFERGELEDVSSKPLQRAISKYRKLREGQNYVWYMVVWKYSDEDKLPLFINLMEGFERMGVDVSELDDVVKLHGAGYRELKERLAESGGGGKLPTEHPIGQERVGSNIVTGLLHRNLMPLTYTRYGSHSNFMMPGILLKA